MQNPSANFNVQKFITDYLLQQSVILNAPNTNKTLHKQARELACELDHMKNLPSVSIEERGRAAAVVECIHATCDRIEDLCISGILDTPSGSINQS